MEEVVLLSPIRPRSTGLGLAMRADRILQALARLYKVHLRVIPVHEYAPEPSGERRDESHATTWQEVWLQPNLLRRFRYAGNRERSGLAPGLGAALRASLAGMNSTRIFAFRQVMLPLAFELAEGRVPVVVDLDELESHASEQISRLLTERGERRAAGRLRRRGEHYREREIRELPRAAQIWVASAAEQQRVRTVIGADAQVVPNVVELRNFSPRAIPEDQRTLLFVGGLGYVPNLDAAEWMARKVLPQMGPGRRINLRLVGTSSARVSRSLRRFPGVQLAGYAESLDAEYARTTACVVPIRAGGGTRIKLLEALAHGCPVVSTTLGAEGLDLEPGRDLLIADTARDFAHACNRILENPVLSERLGTEGRARVLEAYTPDVFHRAVVEADELLAGRTP